MRLRFVAMLSFVLVLLPGCHPSKVKEVLEGSDVWVQELTRDITIEVVAGTNVRPGERLPWSIRLLNRGEHEPHVSTVMFGLLDVPGEVTCLVEQPSPLEIDHDDEYIYFLLRPTRVVFGTTTVVSGWCEFSRPGRYRLLLSGSFKESSVAFVSEILTVEVR